MITKEFFENMSIVAIRNHITALEVERKDYKKTMAQLNKENEELCGVVRKQNDRIIELDRLTIELAASSTASSPEGG